jgi:hypothetical protein
MNVAIELPEDIARQLQAAWPDVPRRLWKRSLLKGIARAL